jgi:DNA (cytosine-5)-methyltransferase 1
MGEGGHNKPVIMDSWGIRNLTPEECLRLQGFNDGFAFPEPISITQRYKQLGNTVTVSLVEKIALECRAKLQSIEGGRN